MNIRAFEFGGGLKRNLMIGMGIGLVSLAVQFLTGDQYHTEFWSTWLHHSVFFTGIAFTAAFFLAGLIIGFGGWMTAIRRIWEAMSMFMIVGLVLLAVIVLGVWGHFHHLYHWNTPGITDPSQPHFDKILAGKAGFLNPTWFSIAAIGFVALWYFLAKKMRDVSLAQDEHETSDFKMYKKSRNWAAWYLPAAGFLSPLFFWQLTMSVEPHWYSTMFAWYSMVSVWLASLSLTMLLLIYLKSQGYLDYVSKDHLHDVGKFLFGISVFWTYLWFDQFMLIWYANNGEETIYFKERMEHYPVLFYGNLLINFVAPFLILMRNDNKRKFGTLTIAALIIFFGHWWDFFYMIKPAARVAAFEASHVGGHGHDAHTTTLDAHAGDKSMAEHASDAVAHAADGAKEAVETAGAHVADAAGHVAEGVKDAAHAATDHVADAAKGTAAAEAAAMVAQDVKEIAEHASEKAEMEADHGDAAHAEANHGDAAHTDGGHGHDTHGAVAPHGGHPGPKHFQLGYTIPGPLDFGALIGFLSLFLFVFFSHLSKASLLPKNDPFLDETLHHATGAHIDSEIEAAGGHGHH